MKNAHERFGKLVYRRRTEKTATNLRVFLDAFVGEDRGKAHLVSVVGGDVEIGALAAAFANGDSFTVVDPYGEESIVSLGEKPLCFRGSIVVPGRKRPLRHLVSCSQELADTTSDGKLLLISDDHSFIWSSLVRHYGLPATPEWGPWMIAQLQQQKRIQPLPGFGYAGVAVKAKRKELLALLRKGLRSNQLAFPPKMGPSNGPRSSSSRRLPDSRVKSRIRRLPREPTIRGCTTHPHSEQFWEDPNPWRCYIQATAFVRRAEASTAITSRRALATNLLK